jgi:molybdopterin/thiamine biosynthesis adenylyltransferase
MRGKGKKKKEQVMKEKRSVTLSPEEKERYRRQMILPGWGEEAQGLLKQSCVFIAGAGGLGSPVALYLAAAGVGALRICDSGTVELSNLNRQILHGQDRIGRNKAISAEQTLKRINPAVRVTALTDTINTRNIASLVGEAGLMIDCLDNLATRHVLNACALERALPLIHAGVSGMYGQLTFIRPPETACLACLLPSLQSEGTFPIVGAAAGVLGCMEALEALKYLTGAGELLMARLLFFDGQSMQFHEASFDRDPDCPVCGSGSP